MMKGCLFVCLMATVCFACVMHEWRGKEVWCCPNGTKYRTGKQTVWSASVPLMCKGKHLQEEPKGEKKNIFVACAWLVVFLVVGGLCVGYGVKKYLR